MDSHWLAYGSLFFGLFGTQLVLACSRVLLPSEEQANVGSVGKVYSSDCRRIDSTATMAVLSVSVLTTITWVAQIICVLARDEVDKLHAVHGYADLDSSLGGIYGCWN